MMAKAVAQTQERQSPSVALVRMIEGRTEDIKSILAPGVRVDAFVRTIKNALIKDPKIAEADQQSVFLECQKAAQDGLVLDGREAVLTRFNTKKRWKEDGAWKEKYVVEVTYIPMTYGIIKRVMNSGLVRAWHVGVVYSNELEQGRFVYYAGDNPRIEHEPIIIGDRGDVVAIYSSVRLTDGTYHHDVMSVDDINRIMERTKSRKWSKDGPGEIIGPWATDWIEMGKKTVVRRHSKRLPMSSENMQMVERVDALYDFEKDGDAYVDPGPKPKAVTNKMKTSAAKKLAAPTQDIDDDQVDDMTDAEDDRDVADPETGELRDKAIDGEIMDPEDGDAF